MNDLRFESAGVLGAGIVGGLFLTTRVERINVRELEEFRAGGQPVLLVCWHGQLLPLIHYHRHEGITVLVSEHEDGEYLTRVMEHSGFRAVRGSSRRGGSKGLRGLVKAAREGSDVAVTPDGPTGPHGVFKPGALLAAQLQGLPVIPIAVAASAGWRFRSWDGFLVPRPFSRITIEYLPARTIPRQATREQLDGIAAEIGAALNAAGPAS